MFKRLSINEIVSIAEEIGNEVKNVVLKAIGLYEDIRKTINDMNNVMVRAIGKTSFSRKGFLNLLKTVELSIYYLDSEYVIGNVNGVISTLTMKIVNGAIKEVSIDVSDEPMYSVIEIDALPLFFPLPRNAKIDVEPLARGRMQATIIMNYEHIYAELEKIEKPEEIINKVRNKKISLAKLLAWLSVYSTK